MVLDAQYLEILMTEKILIIQTAFLGDAILTLPLIQYVKKQNSDSLVDVIAIPSTKEIFANSPSVNSVIVLDKKSKHNSFRSLLKFVKELRKQNYSKVISPHRSFRTSLIIALLGVKDSTGFDKAAINFVYKNKVKHEWNDHEVLRNLKLTDFVGSDWKIKPEINSTEECKKRINEILINYNLQNFIVIAPGSVWFTKAYPLEKYAEVANHFIKNKYKIVLIGGENEKLLCKSLELLSDGEVVNLTGRLTLTESIELMRYSQLVICNDSAPTHMGMSADIPVLTIYCSTVPEFGFYPYNEKSKYLSFNDLKCKPCGIHGKTQCPIKTFECAEKLEPKTIIETALKMIS